MDDSLHAKTREATLRGLGAPAISEQRWFATEARNKFLALVEQLKEEFPRFSEIAPEVRSQPLAISIANELRSHRLDAKDARTVEDALAAVRGQVFSTSVAGVAAKSFVPDRLAKWAPKALKDTMGAQVDGFAANSGRLLTRIYELAYNTEPMNLPEARREELRHQAEEDMHLMIETAYRLTGYRTPHVTPEDIVAEKKYYRVITPARHEVDAETWNVFRHIPELAGALKGMMERRGIKKLVIYPTDNQGIGQEEGGIASRVSAAVEMQNPVREDQATMLEVAGELSVLLQDFVSVHSIGGMKLALTQGSGGMLR